MLGHCEHASSFKPRKSNPPNVLKRFQPDNEGDACFREFQSSHDKSETFPSPSKIAQEQKSKEKVKKPGGMEKPRKPAIDADLKESLKQVTLKKTGLLVDNNGKNDNRMEESLNDNESCKKNIGKLDRSKFENLHSSPLVETNVGAFNDKPPLMQKPVIKSEKPFTQGIKPKPVKSKTFVSPPSQPEFPPPPDEIYEDVDVAHINISESNCQQKSPSLPNIKPKPPSRKKVWPPPPELMPDSSNEEEVYGDVDNNDTPNTQSDHRNSQLGKEGSISSNIISKPSKVVVSPAVVLQSHHPLEPESKDEIYGDVDANEENTIKVKSDGRFDEDGEAIYDSVENVIDFDPSNHPEVSGEADMIYDDIADMIPSQPVQPLDPPDDIYDDVDQNSISLLQQTTNLLLNNSKYKSDLYLSPADGICDSTTPISSPPKPSKTFGELDATKFTIPFGLDAWLYQILCANQFKLQQNGMSCNFFDSYSCGSYFPGITNLQKKPSDLDTSSIKSTDSKQEKENKKEKKKLKQLEKERKAKEQQKQKRLEKDLKNFNLDLNKEQTVIGTVCASSESKGSKKDLAYQYGDEIEILQTTHECPAGKILAQNASSQRIGYIIKADFQLDDSIFADGKSKVSLIPTEDEEGLYPGSEESFQQPTIARRPAGAPPLPTVPPPPPPQTPRPFIKPVIPVQTAQEEIYAECADLVASTQKGHIEQAYDTIGVNS